MFNRLALQRMADDLFEVLSDLVRPGVDEGILRGANDGLLAEFDCERAAQQLSRLVPVLLASLQAEEVEHAGEWRLTGRPRTAAIASRPGRYDLKGKTVVPTRWHESVPNSALPLAPLRWLLHVINAVLDSLKRREERIGKWVQDAKRARGGDTRYAVDTVKHLEAVQQPVQVTLERLLAARDRIVFAAGSAIVPSPRVPHPFPQSAPWRELRREIFRLSSPLGAVPDFISAATGPKVDIAKISFLYQRWVGLQLIRSLERHGLAPVGDWAGALFLGGEIGLRSAICELTVWVEARIHADAAHPSGVRAVSQNSGWDGLTPDFLIIGPGAGGRDAFVLDATTNPNEAVHRSKNEKYASGMFSEDILRIAGIPTRRHVKRAWTASPIEGEQNRLYDDIRHSQVYGEIGRTGSGCVSISPDRLRFGPLDAWVADICSHTAIQHREKGDREKGP